MSETQFQLPASEVISQTSFAVVAAEIKKTEAIAALREAYSYPVSTGFLWFKKTRPASDDEIEKRFQASSDVMSHKFDYAWNEIWMFENHARKMRNLIEQTRINGVDTVLLSDEHAKIIVRYLNNKND